MQASLTSAPREAPPKACARSAPMAAPAPPPPRRRDVPAELRRGVALLLPAELPYSGRLDPEDEHEGRLITNAYTHDAHSTMMLYDVRAPRRRAHPPRRSVIIKRSALARKLR